MDAEYLQGFYLGDLLIEPLKGRVSGRNGERHLPPKAVEVLVCLARNAGDVVPHDKLLECAWGKGAGSRESLSHTIGEIRLALDDHPDNPRYVQTLPRLGYRLVADPVTVDAHSDSVILGADDSVAMQRLGLLESLQQRGVLETGIAYLVLGWLIIQVADVVFDRLNFPDWATTFVIVLVGVGHGEDADAEEAVDAPDVEVVADVEDERLVDKRLDLLKKQITEAWLETDPAYDLIIEPEIYWRRGGPPERRAGEGR